MKQGSNKLHKISFANIVDTRYITINTLINETDCNLALNEGIMNKSYSLSLRMQSGLSARGNTFKTYLINNDKTFFF